MHIHVQQHDVLTCASPKHVIPVVRGTKPRCVTMCWVERTIVDELLAALVGLFSVACLLRFRRDLRGWGQVREETGPLRWTSPCALITTMIVITTAI
eukprot:1110246-Pyramimonas_sp.AAC.1